MFSFNTRLFSGNLPLKQRIVFCRTGSLFNFQSDLQRAVGSFKLDYACLHPSIVAISKSDYKAER